METPAGAQSSAKHLTGSPRLESKHLSLQWLRRSCVSRSPEFQRWFLPFHIQTAPVQPPGQCVGALCPAPRHPVLRQQVVVSGEQRSAPRPPALRRGRAHGAAAGPAGRGLGKRRAEPAAGKVGPGGRTTHTPPSPTPTWGGAAGPLREWPWLRPGVAVPAGAAPPPAPRAMWPPRAAAPPI